MPAQDVAVRVARFGNDEVVVANRARELLELGNQARVLDVGDDRPADTQVVASQEQDEHHAQRGTRGAGEAARQTNTGQRSRRREDERTGQDDRQESTRHPEVIRHDPHLVEKEAAENDDCADERRIAKETPDEQRQTNQSGYQRGKCEVKICERSQGTRVVFGEFSHLVPED